MESMLLYKHHQEAVLIFSTTKKTHSISLLAVCDANYEFTLVDVGDSGRQSDGGVYANSKLGYAIDNNLLGIPNADYIQDRGNNIKYPFVFVADDAFTLRTYMIKPYPSTNLHQTKVICNYRISCARRVIENSFGILASRFRIFRRPILANVETVCNIVKATLALHNFLMTDTSADAYCPYAYCPRNYIDKIRLSVKHFMIYIIPWAIGTCILPAICKTWSVE